MMRGELKKKFLELIDEVGGHASDHLAAFLISGYGSSVEKKLRQRYHVMLSSLKRDGLVQSAWRGNKKMLTTTRRGEVHLKELRRDLAERLLIPSYKLETGSQVIIVAFDIPETDRRKRAWLRSVLKNIGLKMIQQSVWVGKGIIPESFIKDLEKAGIIDFVEIFEVTKSGTLSQVI